MRRRADRGSAVVELVWLLLLLLVPLVYLLIAVFDVQRASYGLSGAARAAARAYSLAPDEASAPARARAAAAVALHDQRVDPGDVFRLLDRLDVEIDHDRLVVRAHQHAF